ncbi:hypothetical protein Rhal01_00869 [Rubritalea halochordaticola]|uniref:Protein BatD n=1 Tax=Rubritalea halochordaticola TaxID=714537 RepID=A0ABP9UY96_9BACT
MRQFKHIYLFLLLPALVALMSMQHVHAEDKSSPLGMPVKVTDVYIPGSQVEPIPRKNLSSSLVIRILEIKPASEGFRYDMEVYGLDPGTHQLSKYLQYADSKEPVSELDTALEVTVQHPADTLPKPQKLSYSTPSNLSNYRVMLWTLASVWILIFLLILFYRKKNKDASGAEEVKLSTYEKIQELVLATAHGDLSHNQQAELERLIIGHWKKQVPGLEFMPTADAITQLRTHTEASPLVLKIEHWLHAPSASVTQKEIEPLLTTFKKENQ